MSSPGFFYSPEDQQSEAAIQRRQAYARALLQQGGSDAGNGAYGGLKNAGSAILGAILSNRADKSEAALTQSAGSKYAKALASVLNPQPEIAPVNVTPQITGGTPELQQRQAAGDYSQPTMRPPSTQEALANSGNPALMQQFAPAMIQGQLGRENKVFDNNLPMSRAATEQGAMGLKNQEDAASFTNKLPVTAYQQAQLDNQANTLKETTRHNQAGELTDDQIDPDTVKYWSQSVAAGAPLPALGMGKQAALYRQAILKGAAQINSDKGLTGTDQNVNTATTKANSGALVKQTALRSATEGFENTMLQNMNVVRDVLKKGAGTTGIPVFNRYQQYIRGQYQGDPDVVALSNAIDTVADENAKIRSGTLGNTPATDAMRASIHKGLNDSQTPEQILGAFGIMEKDAGNRSRALRAQEEALKRGLNGKSDLPEIPGIKEPQAQGQSGNQSAPPKVLKYDAQGNRVP